CAFSLYCRMSEARRFNYSDGPFGGVSGGECSGLPVDTVLNQGEVVGFHFDADRVEAFDECGLNRGAASRERVKHDTTRRGDETDQPTHDFQGLDSTVLYPVHVRTLRLRGLRAVEKPGRATTSAVADIGCGSGVLAFGVDEAVTDLPSAPVASHGHPVFLVPALFVYPCGGVVVEQHVRRPTTTAHVGGGCASGLPADVLVRESAYTA